MKNDKAGMAANKQDNKNEEDEDYYAPKDFERGSWLNPESDQYGRGRQHKALFTEVAALAHGTSALESIESAFITLAEDEPANYHEVMISPDVSKWKEACKQEYNTLLSYHTWTLVERQTLSEVGGLFMLKETTSGK